MGALEWEQFGISNTELLESEGLLRALPIALASVALILKRGVYNGTPPSKVRSNSVWLLSRVLICFYCYKLDSANGFVARFFRANSRSLLLVLSSLSFTRSCFYHAERGIQVTRCESLGNCQASVSPVCEH